MVLFSPFPSFISERSIHLLVDLRIYKSLVTATSQIEIQLELDCADLEIREEG